MPSSGAFIHLVGFHPQAWEAVQVVRRQEKIGVGGQLA